MVNKSTIKIEAPLRIDFCGGFTDVEEINKMIGTSITNVAIDLYRDVGRNQKINFNISLSFIRNSEKKSESKPYYKQFLSSSIIEYSKLDDDFSEIVDLNFDLPVSTGLGTSGTISVLLIAAANAYKGSVQDFTELLRNAQEFERYFLKIKGGCQDFISAINGGYNFITIPIGKPAEIRVRNCKVSTALQSYVNENVFIVYSKRKFSSGEILNDIIRKVNLEDGGIEFLKRIKICNEIFNRCLNISSMRIKFEILKKTIEETSLLRDAISNASKNESLEIIKDELLNFIYCSHTAGAGGSCLIIYGIEKFKNEILDKILNREELGLNVFFPKVNNHGLTITEL
jgi:galactokinase/mevalonate kinase-like predicted kinase